MSAITVEQVRFDMLVLNNLDAIPACDAKQCDRQAEWVVRHRPERLCACTFLFCAGHAAGYRSLLASIWVGCFMCSECGAKCGLAAIRDLFTVEPL